MDSGIKKTDASEKTPDVTIVDSSTELTSTHPNEQQQTNVDDLQLYTDVTLIPKSNEVLTFTVKSGKHSTKKNKRVRPSKCMNLTKTEKSVESTCVSFIFRYHEFNQGVFLLFGSLQ